MVQILLSISCITVDTRPAIVERNKSARPDWVSYSQFLTPYKHGHELRIVSFAKSSPTLESGADQAFIMANHKILEFFMDHHFGGIENSDIKKQAYEIGNGYLSKIDHSRNFSLCDIYYEKRKEVTLSNGVGNDTYDTYLCLVVKNPQQLLGEIRNKINASDIGFRVKEMLGH